MGLVQNLKKTLNEWGDRILVALSSQYIKHGKTNFDETRQLFVNGVLTETLDSGVPRYYNGNILNRYFRKDYYEGDG